MTDDCTHDDRSRRNPHLAGFTGRSPAREADGEATEVSCGAFGYLRGIKDASAALEFRFRNGNSVWFPYAWLGNWQYNPSEGLLLKFSGDLVYLVLIRGSNLDRPLNEGDVDLLHAGLPRHRVVWIREMPPEEIRKVGEKGPTIESIELAEFESHEALKDWLSRKAPAFLSIAN